MKNRKVYLLVIIVVAAGLLLFNGLNEKRRYSSPDDRGVNDSRVQQGPPSDAPARRERFNRRTSRIVYTKHARCRMKCRHIDDSEVKEILEKGTINYDKSEPAARPDPKYALEGRTHDDQYVRIIFAPSDRGMFVITVIDLEKEWSCNCK